MSDDRPRDLFLEAVRSHADIRADAKRFEGLLKDFYQGNYRKESAVLSNCVREGVPDALDSAKRDIPYAVVSAPLARRLVDNWGTTEELAQWAVDSWALALGIVTESDLLPRVQTLSIASDPPGAKAMVDDRVVGTTPIEVKPIASGAHRVECAKDGYLAATASIMIGSGEHAQMSLTLKRPAPAVSPTHDISTFVVTSLPADAEIYIDNQRVGRTPMSITGVVPGSHVIRCSLPGYNDQSVTSSIRAFEEKHHTLTLSPLVQGPGGIRVVSTPSGCAIYLDGVYRGTTPLHLDKVPAGHHDIGCIGNGYKKKLKTVNIQQNRVLDVQFSLEKADSSPNLLSFFSQPSGASLFINQKKVGETPITVEIPNPGTISVVCTHPGYRRWYKDLSVGAGSPNSLTINLVPEGATRRSSAERKLPPLMPRPMAVSGICLSSILFASLYGSVVIYGTASPASPFFLVFSLWGFVGSYYLYKMRKIGFYLIAPWIAIIILLLGSSLSAYSQSVPSGASLLILLVILLLVGEFIVIWYYRSYFIE